MIARAVTGWVVLAMAAGLAQAAGGGVGAAPKSTAPGVGASNVGGAPRGSPAAPAASAPTTPADIAKLLPDTKSPQAAASMMQWVVIVTVLSLAPAVLVMVTSFTRIIVVLSLLRQAFAAQNVPPNQVLFGLALLMTVAVMAPVWQGVYKDSVSPMLAGEITRDEAIAAGEGRVRKFMIRQIEAGGNADDVYLFLPKELAESSRSLKWGDVPTVSLVPAFAVSELKIAFYMGFRVFLPFVIVDILVGAVLVSMGMLMLPPAMVSLPFKLLLFVLADGWHLVVGTLMTSFG